jgi:PBS lyase HEAT-like repeat.
MQCSPLFCRLIKKIADKQVVNALIPILKEEDDAARFYAAKALGRIGSPHAVKALAGAR